MTVRCFDQLQLLMGKNNFIGENHLKALSAAADEAATRLLFVCPAAVVSSAHRTESLLGWIGDDRPQLRGLGIDRN